MIAGLTLAELPQDSLIDQAVTFHGHMCPGTVLGVRMALAGCRAVHVPKPRSAGKDLVVFVEIDRCATDAIQALTGVSLGKRTLKHIDYGKMAATFVNVPAGQAVRVAARESARELAWGYAPGAPDLRSAQTIAYRKMPDEELLALSDVTVQPGWLDRRRLRVACDVCGEGINYQRQVDRGGQTLCRACTGEPYYLVA